MSTKKTNKKEAPSNAKAKSAYADAGVDIDSKMSGIQNIKKMVASTKTAQVLGGIGSFGGLFRSPGAEEVLVASTDGVGTKLKVAALSKCHTTVGQDIVNHCVNDILVQGAKPLFFMDYIGAAKFDQKIFQDVVWGLCKACKENGCALLGGETAEMPGLYPVGEYDLVGTIVGVVNKKKIITGSSIRAGDMIIGLPSGGLQTNGYSLARRVIFDKLGLTPNDLIPGTRKTVAETLLAVHKSFLKPVSALLDRDFPIRGMAHITGGGFIDNIPRVLPKTCDAVIDRNAWEPPTVFKLIENQGRVDHDEMYRVFNMGIGFVIIVRKADVQSAMNTLKRMRQDPVIIGCIKKGTGKVSYSS